MSQETTILYVLTQQYEDHGHQLLGIYSTHEKAELATQSRRDFFGKAKMYEWEREVREHKVMYHALGVVLTIDRWELDRALVGGQWKIL